ncbi:MAG TPA: TDP-N-acetylfucosamine:lipid II N-acetylfucosaminyltransferase [Candidatus Rifleibacterium sp.]|nr:TDP-N-acetylfucosamine:lipid II N-acetylfucosaminyltransferase [Candidatus Rifleibacterium sp.]
MILHIAHDEKFIDIAYRSFEAACPGGNDFVIVSDCSKLQHIRSPKVRILNRNEIVRSGFLDSLKKYDFVVLHSLTGINQEIVVKASPEIKFLWLGWGYDYYNYFKEGESALFQPSTLALYNSQQKQPTLYKLLRSKAALLYHLLMNRHNLFKKCLRKIDYFSPVLPGEYELCKNQFKRLQAKYTSWNYGTLEDDLSIEGLTLEGSNILLGNSASYANNHLEAMDCLQKLAPNLPGKIITPLSYGNPVYSDKVIQSGTKKLGDKFAPLIDFMAPKDYLKLISSCRYVIMNHLRQQAMGNIVMMMNLGASIFLNPANPAYAFFVDRGAHIFCVDDLSPDRNFKDFDLTAGQIEKNRTILKNHWGREEILQKTKKLIEVVISTPKL